jgi:capsular exopolysaccharide synthesis family protein
MEPNIAPFPVNKAPQTPATGIPFAPTGSPFSPTGSPFMTTTSPFGVTGAPFSAGANPNGPRANDDFSFKELIELISHSLLVIRAKWYWGLLGAAIVGGLVGYVLFHRPVEYTAETNLLAQSTLDKVISVQSGADATTDVSRENSLRNHLSMMTSRKFRARLEAAFTPEEKNLISGPYLKAGQSADSEFFQDFFENKIAIERERGREYYTVGVTHKVATTAMLIADRMASEYLEFLQEQYKDANLLGYRLLEKQADILREEMARIESASLDYQKKNGIISRADNQSILNERLKQLDQSLTETRIKRVGLETQAKQAHADRARSQFPWDNSYLATYANTPDLHKELDDQTAIRAGLATRYGPNHPKMRDVDSQIKGLQSSILRNFDVAVGDLDSQLEIAIQTEKLIKREFDEAFDSSIDIEKLASNYEILSARVDSKKVALEALEKKIGEASISSQLPTDFMEIVDPAYLVKHRIPRSAIFAAITGFLALGAFIVTPLVASALDERVSGTSDVEKELGIGLAGAIPALKLRIEDRAHVVRNKLDSVTTESFVGIVGQLEIGAAQRYPKVILVTSTLPSEGKSLIASNLASTFRQLGKRCLLVDLDLRRPAQHSLHGVPQDRGFLVWGRLGYPMDGLLDPQGPLGVRTLVDGTDLVPSGGIEEQPSQFLISESMDRLIGFMKGCYDVVILDTPPAGVFQDALMLARYASERVLVAREGVAPVVQVKKVIGDFTRASFAFQGVVLNGFIPRNANKKLAYGYQAAAKGYQYGGDGNDTKPPKKKAALGEAIKAAAAQA